MSSPEQSPHEQVDSPYSARRISGLRYMCPIPKKLERNMLKEHTLFGNQPHGVIARIERDAIYRTQRKLTGIGLTLTDYMQTWAAFKDTDVATLSQISQRGDRNIELQRTGVNSTADEYVIGKDAKGKNVYSKEREALHQEIIDSTFAGQTPSDNPTLLILAGPPGGGKSRERKTFIAKQGSAIFADTDEIRHHLIDDFDPQNNIDIQRTYQESYDITDKIFARAVAGGYNIIHEGTLRSLKGYGNGTGATRAIDTCTKNGKNYDVETVFVHSALEECFRRSIVFRERGVALSVLLHASEGFENFLTLRDYPGVTRSRIVDNTMHGNDLQTHVEEESEILKLREYYSSFANGRVN